ncbi:type I-U CRISPR-associated protein Csb2, partial [uncultured Corynebacterium sp.]|uniref:type I-G CRISPR-associated protein Csb2 n=1 Tax=uncultured Corynebacterium sp. TaxID=159447 RepID=UPI002604CF2B
MRELNLIARFPLGVYIGHSGKGAADRFPSPLRLHSALLNSAGQGTAAVEESRGLGPSEKSLAALSWLEENPPTRRFIYREVSSVNEKRRTEERRLSDGRAVKGHVGYRWVSVPDDIAETIVELCRDVSCLGETESVVVLEPGDVRPT